MDLDVVAVMGLLAFLGIGVSVFIESVAARRNARHVEDNHAGIAWKELHERRQAVSPKRKRGNAA